MTIALTPTAPLVGFPDVQTVFIADPPPHLTEYATDKGFVWLDMFGDGHLISEPVIYFALPDRATGEPAWEWSIRRTHLGAATHRILTIAYEVAVPTGYLTVCSHLPLRSDAETDACLLEAAKRGRINRIECSADATEVISCETHDLGGFAHKLRAAVRAPADPVDDELLALLVPGLNERQADHMQARRLNGYEPAVVVGNAAGAAAGGRVGRNEPCPCGATKPDGAPVKFKKCCWG